MMKLPHHRPPAASHDGRAAFRPIPVPPRPRTVLLAALMLVLCGMQAGAQFRLFIGTPDLSDPPRIHIPFKAIDKSATVRDLTADSIEVYENGVRQSPLTLDCTQQEVAQTVHFMFIMDVSRSMGFIEGTEFEDPDSIKWKRAKSVMIEAFHALRPIDYGAFIAFSAVIHNIQPFTRNTRLLENAVGGLEIESGTAIYDAVRAGLNQCTADTGKTVIILLTDGTDVSSYNTLVDAIDHARSRGIPVYSIGLGVEPSAMSVLDSLSRLTGGEFLLAPTSDDLADVFARIMHNIMTSDCILTYTPQDTCSDGGQHIVDVSVRYNGSIVTERFAYTSKDFRSRVWLAAMPPDTTRDDMDVDIPVVITGELRAGEPLAAELDVSFDAALTGSPRIVTTGTLLAGQPATITQTGPGVARVSIAATALPRGLTYGSSDTLFVLRLAVAHRLRVDSGRVAIRFVSIGQHCPVIAAGIERRIVVLGCQEKLVLAIDTTRIAGAGDRIAVPISLRTPVDPAQPLRYSFTVSYDDRFLAYAGHVTSGTLSAFMPVSVTESGPGALSVRADPAYPTDSSGTLIILFFDVHPVEEGAPVFFRIERSSFVQACSPAVTIEGDRFWIDGVCRHLVRRLAAARIDGVFPNPARAADPRATMRIAASAPMRVRVEIFDARGVRLGCCFDGEVAEGLSELRLQLPFLPAGTYHIVLRDGNGRLDAVQAVFR